MNKYTLINCYSDNNKGDLGIILSTINYINEHDKLADIAGISTYNFSDPSYHTEHMELKKNITIYPSIFGELNICKNKSRGVKIIRFIWDTLRVLLYLILPSLTAKILFSTHEKKTLERLKESDYIVSKGGSFICNENNWRDKIALIRFLYIFLLCFKLNKKVIILFQSLGPVYGRLSIRYVNYVINKCYKVALREEVCFRKYPYIKYPKETIFSNDIAFYLPTLESKIITGTEFKIGITTKYVEKREFDSYKRMLIEGIENILSKEHNVKIYFFNHVPIDNDIESSWEIYKDIRDSYKNKISFITSNHNPQEIKYLYGKMDAFIGTRLHSTIFAMGECVPSLCIAYHGTKAQGILQNMDSGKYVVTSYDTKEFINKFNELCDNLSSQKKTLKNRLDYWSIDMNQNFKKIFNDK